MRKSLFTISLVTILLVIGLIVATAIPALAAPQTEWLRTGVDASKPKRTPPPPPVIKTPTVISLNAVDAITMTQPYTLSGYIKDRNGQPIPGVSVLFTIGNTYLGQALSDETGFFQRKFTARLNSGSYQITALFKGTHFLDSTLSVTTITVLPWSVQVQTVPPIAGVPFQIAGQLFYSDTDGLASININEPGTYRLFVVADQFHDPLEKIEFSRWVDDNYQPYQDIQVPSNKVIQAGFNVYHQVGQSFVDLNGYPVDPHRVTQFSIRSAQGDVFLFNNGNPRWIPASRVERRTLGLEETKLLYSVTSVIVDGSNVVNSSQQRFYTYPNKIWPISLLLYTMRVSASDGLFGFPAGKSVNVIFPDGQMKNYPFDPKGMVTIHSLARGNYDTELVGTNGLNYQTPVALSRNQNVDWKVITHIDMAVVGCLGLALVLGVLLYGRPQLLRLRIRKTQPA